MIHTWGDFRNEAERSVEVNMQAEVAEAFAVAPAGIATSTALANVGSLRGLLIGNLK